MLGYTRPRIKHQHISFLFISTNECMLLGAQNDKNSKALFFTRSSQKSLLSQTLSENKQLQGWKYIKNRGQLQWEVTDISLHHLLSITRVHLWNRSATRWRKFGKDNCFTIFFFYTIVILWWWDIYRNFKNIETQRGGMELIHFGMNMWENKNFYCKGKD